MYSIECADKTPAHLSLPARLLCTRPGPTPIGARKANLTEATLPYLEEIAINEQGSVTAAACFSCDDLLCLPHVVFMPGARCRLSPCA